MFVIMNRMGSEFGYDEMRFGEKHYSLPCVNYHLRETPELKTRLKILFNDKGFGCNIDQDNNVNVSWNDEKPIMPTILAKDLMGMGYDTTKLGIILDGLRMALAKGDATTLTRQSQIIWIQNHFPLK